MILIASSIGTKLDDVKSETIKYILMIEKKFNISRFSAKEKGNNPFHLIMDGKLPY